MFPVPRDAFQEFIDPDSAGRLYAEPPGGPRDEPPAPAAATGLAVSRFREMLERRRAELRDVRARLAGVQRSAEATALLDRACPSETSGHPDAPDLWRVSMMHYRIVNAHLWDEGDEFPAMLGGPHEWEAVRELRDEITAVLKEGDAVRRLVERRAAALEEAEGPQPGDSHLIRNDDPEALAWLRGGGELTGNAFSGEGDAVRFVERLYAAGAERVVIAEDCIETGEDPPYADAVRVKLPAEKAARSAVLRAIRSGAPDFDARDDVRWNVAFIWWD